MMVCSSVLLVVVVVAGRASQVTKCGVPKRYGGGAELGGRSLVSAVGER